MAILGGAGSYQCVVKRLTALTVRPEPPRTSSTSVYDASFLMVEYAPTFHDVASVAGVMDSTSLPSVSRSETLT